MLYKKHLTKEQAIQKIKHYCGYQERCHKDVKDKLYQLGVRKNEQDEIIASLIEENYLNEERFAIQFAGGKFRMNNWGRMKIKYELKQKQVSEYCIKKALQQLDETAYIEALKKLVADKLQTLETDQHLVKKKKTMDYLIGKGYEMDLIRQVLEKK